MTVTLKVSLWSISNLRRACVASLICLGGALTSLWPHAAAAQPLTVGARAECDPTGLKTYYKPGTVIPFHPGETFNGNAAGSGYFYRVHIDGQDADGTLCKAEDMRRATAPSPQAAAATPPRLATNAGPTAARMAQAAPRPGASRFGTREPRTCAPQKTMPNNEQIKMLLQCQREGKTPDQITLVEHITVQAGATRRYNYNADSFNSTIDPSAPVLPLRGSFDQYQCNKITVPTGGPGSTRYDTDNTGKNCLVTPEHAAYGECYRTTFGDWKCNMQEATDPSRMKSDQPPPR